MSYLAFLAVFVCLPAGVLAAARPRTAFGWPAVALLAGIAFAAAAPWDNALVARGVWSYGADRVLGVVGRVPVEEYAFFLLQPLLVGTWTLHVLRGAPSRDRLRAPSVRVWGAAGGVAVACAGLWLALRGGETTYLGWILAWAGLPLGLQWAWDGPALWARRGRLAAAVVPMALYLGAADLVALRDGIWAVTPSTSTGASVGGLPVEEGLFFVVTSLLVAQGVLLAVDRWGHPAPARWPAAPDAATPTVRRTVGRTVLWPSRVAMGALVLVGPASMAWPLWALAAPLALGLVAFGLPHGALDHCIGARPGVPLAGAALGRRLLLYAAAAALVLVVWRWAPLASALAFLLLTWVHWGQGDVHALVAFGGARHLRTRAQRAATLVVRGGLPMLVPLLAFPEVYFDVVGWMRGALGASPNGLAAVALLGQTTMRLGLGAAFGGLALATLALGAVRTAPDGWRAWGTDVGETIGLAVVFGTVHPLLSVGWYFAAWHAPRHLARLVAWSPGGAEALEQGRSARAWARLARQAAPATLGALALLAGLWAAVRPASAGAAVGLYLALLAALTVPHTAVVTAMDRAEGIW